MKSKHVYQDYNIDKAHQYFDEHNLILDEFDGVVSFKDQDSTSRNETIAVTFRNVTSTFYAYKTNSRPSEDISLYFTFNSSKGDRNHSKNLPDGYTVETWFDVLVRASIILAKCINRHNIIVRSGRTDAKMIQAKGFSKHPSQSFCYIMKI